MMTEENNVSAAVEAGMHIGEPRMLADNQLAVVLVPSGAKVERIDLRELEEKYALNPRRKTGSRELTTVESFLAYVLAHASGATSIYAKKANTSFLAILNGHSTLPGHGDFTASYNCPVSVEWKRWMAHSQHAAEAKKGTPQAEFMMFLEDNLQDIINPASGLLLQAVRSFEAKKDVTFKSATRLEDGSVTFNYSEAVNEVAQEGKLSLPSQFTIGIPVFDNGAKYELDARLRYRISGGGLVLWYELVNPHKVVEHAFNGVLLQVKEGAPSVPVYSV